MEQQFFNVAIAIISALGGWWMKAMWAAVRDLQAQDRELAEKVSSIEVLVAGAYVKREELREISAAIFKKLDRIEQKVDSKQDKWRTTHCSPAERG